MSDPINFGENSPKLSAVASKDPPPFPKHLKAVLWVQENPILGIGIGVGLSILLPIILPLLTQARSIYGYDVIKDDARKEIYETSAREQRQARSVALLTQDRQTESGALFTKITGPILREAMKLREPMRFEDQPDLGRCTGFLISENLLLTARHCTEPASPVVSPQEFCSQMRIVFHATIEKRTDEHTLNVPNEDVFRCKQVREIEHARTDLDLAIVELDRPAKGREPFVLKKDPVATKDKVYTLGHPLGLPMKYSGEDPVLNVDDFTVSAQLDTFHGCSGSPVLDAKSGEVVGVLTNGGDDFFHNADGTQSVQIYYPRNSYDEDTIAESATRTDLKEVQQHIQMARLGKMSAMNNSDQSLNTVR